MTQSTNRVFDEFAKLMTDAAGVAQGVRREVETAVRAQAERFFADMDLVSREEFEAVKELAAKAREENQTLVERIAALEKACSGEQPRSDDDARGAKSQAKSVGTAKSTVTRSTAKSAKNTD